MNFKKIANLKGIVQIRYIMTIYKNNLMNWEQIVVIFYKIDRKKVKNLRSLLNGINYLNNIYKNKNNKYLK